MEALNDTIAAIATAPGAAGLAVVRVSGAEAAGVAGRVFRARAPLAAAASHTLHHGWAESAAGARLDEVVAAVFRAPRSYTGEDVIELSCHGGAVPAARVLAALLAAGARLARPGEFTLRAFLHGRLDLAQAEAVADLIHAQTEHAGDLALAQLAGALSRRVTALAGRVADAAAEIEARVDFAEDVGGIEVPAHAIAASRAAAAELAALLAGAPWARAVREGVRVPLVGRPNAGKSSLFNALLGEPRAIVSDVPGTTRDRVSEPLELAGVRVTLSDTAGLRETADAIEAIGVARTVEALEGAALAVWVVDGSRALADEDRSIAARLSDRRTIVALAKRDLPPALDVDDARALIGDAAPVVPVSAATGEGVPELHQALASALGAGDAAGGLAIAVSNPRHAESLERARAALERAADAGEAGLPGEIVALELREARRALGQVTGETADADLLDRIFSRFCIGK